MHAGKVLISDTPKAITKSRNAETLEEAFVAYLQDAIGETEQSAPLPVAISDQMGEAGEAHPKKAPGWWPDLRRMLAYTRREALELKRDPIRATLAILGSVILMFVIGYGINLDVEDLKFAVLDRDDTTISRDYTQQIAGSRYFSEQVPITDYDDLDRRMRDGEISLAIEIPPNFGANVMRGRPVEVAAWIDGAMPTRAETIKGYVQGMHANWLTQKARELYGNAANVGSFNLEIRYRYNPDVQSLVAMVPAVIPLLLLMIGELRLLKTACRDVERRRCLIELGNRLKSARGDFLYPVIGLLRQFQAGLGCCDSDSPTIASTLRTTMIAAAIEFRGRSVEGGSTSGRPGSGRRISARSFGGRFEPGSGPVSGPPTGTGCCETGSIEAPTFVPSTECPSRAWCCRSDAAMLLPRLAY